MIVSPWAITDYEGAGIEPRHMDHLGFKVEDVETFKKRSQGSGQQKSRAFTQAGWHRRRHQTQAAGQMQARPIPARRPDGVPIDVSAGR
jgi:hypothetical protein